MSLLYGTIWYKEWITPEGEIKRQRINHEDIYIMQMFKNMSSFLEGCSYDKDEYSLTVYFKNGKEYKFGDVPYGIYEDFLNADSPGLYFTNTIKKNYKPLVEG